MNNIPKHSSYIITGPTASGKSDFAHRLALARNGVIINCDSVQIYRGIENISASPFAGRAITDEIDGVPYKLFSIFSLDEQISVVDYLNLARAEYDAAISSGRTPIFVGGTGFYINAILDGISPMPDVSDDCRIQARELVARDLDAARALLPPEFKATDPQRISRALEVFFETGHHLSEFQSAPRNGAITPRPMSILINPPLDILHSRIAKRILLMLAGGGLDEARAIAAANWDTRHAIGAAQLCRFLRGELTHEECVAQWLIKTNQYAKRQRTWFRTQFTADLEINTVKF